MNILTFIPPDLIYVTRINCICWRATNGKAARSSDERGLAVIRGEDEIAVMVRKRLPLRRIISAAISVRSPQLLLRLEKYSALRLENILPRSLIL